MLIEGPPFLLFILMAWDFNKKVLCINAKMRVTNESRIMCRLCHQSTSGGCGLWIWGQWRWTIGKDSLCQSSVIWNGIASMPFSVTLEILTIIKNVQLGWALSSCSRKQAILRYPSLVWVPQTASSIDKWSSHELSWVFDHVWIMRKKQQTIKCCLMLAGSWYRRGCQASKSHWSLTRN